MELAPRHKTVTGINKSFYACEREIALLEARINDLEWNRVEIALNRSIVKYLNLADRKKKIPKVMFIERSKGSIMLIIRLDVKQILAFLEQKLDWTK